MWRRWARRHVGEQVLSEKCGLMNGVWQMVHSPAVHMPLSGYADGCPAVMGAAGGVLVVGVRVGMREG